jgi:hypothetical protein
VSPIAIRWSRGAPSAAAREIRRRVSVEEQRVPAGELPTAEEWAAHDEADSETLLFVAQDGARVLGCARRASAASGAG